MIAKMIPPTEFGIGTNLRIKLTTKRISKTPSISSIIPICTSFHKTFNYKL